MLGHPGSWGTHPSPYRMVPRKVDLSGVEPTYRMCTLAKRELMLQTCPEEKGDQCQRAPAGKGQGARAGSSHLTWPPPPRDQSSWRGARQRARRGR